MEQSLVTVVIPVYNAEKYLDRCVESVAGQTYRNLEIILVDDCSPDRCPQICDEWALRDSRIKVLHKAVNEGQGIARNNALNIARGQYICFFDSDDYILSDAIEKLVSAIEKERADLAIGGFVRVTAEEKEMFRFVPLEGGVTYRGNEVQKDFLPELVAPDPKGDGRKKFYMSACMMLYSVEKIRELNWQFVSEREIVSEDVYSLLDLFDGISSVTVVPEAFYCYRCNEVSFSRSYRPGRYEKYRHFYLETMKLCQRKGYDSELCHRVSKPYLSYTLATLKQEAKAPLSLIKRLRNVYRIVNDATLQQVLRQNRHDNVSRTRRIIFFLMRNKCWLLSYLLFRIK